MQTGYVTLDSNPKFQILKKIKAKKFAALDVIRKLSEQITYLNKQADEIRKNHSIPDVRSIPEDYKDLAYKGQEILILLKASDEPELNCHIPSIEELLKTLGVRNGK